MGVHGVSLILCQSHSFLRWGLTQVKLPTLTGLCFCELISHSVPIRVATCLSIAKQMLEYVSCEQFCVTRLKLSS